MASFYFKINLSFIYIQYAKYYSQYDSTYNQIKWDRVKIIQNNFSESFAIKLNQTKYFEKKRISVKWKCFLYFKLLGELLV